MLPVYYQLANYSGVCDGRLTSADVFCWLFRQRHGDARSSLATIVNSTHNKVCTTHVVTTCKDAWMSCLMRKLAVS
jgi:hypothetical protein